MTMYKMNLTVTDGIEVHIEESMHFSKENALKKAKELVGDMSDFGHSYVQDNEYFNYQTDSYDTQISIEKIKVEDED